MSRLDSGILRWRSALTGATGEDVIVATHATCEEANRAWAFIRYWIKGCACDDCEAARGANDDEAQQ